MECPFAEVGCYTKISSSAYQSHLSKNTEQHLQMIMKFHRTMQGSTSSNSSSEDDVVSPLEKLDAVTKELEFLDGALESYDMGQFPALECIKTHLKLPDVWIHSLGDRLTFRLTNFSQNLQNRNKWRSPPFYVQGGYKLCICVHCNGIGSGCGTHLSASLLLFLDGQLEWPVLLPQRTGIRTELLVEVEDDVEEEIFQSKAMDKIELTWKPKDSSASSFKHPSSSNKQLPRHVSSSSIEIEPKAPLRRRSSYLPSWCAGKGEDLETMSVNHSDISSSRKKGKSILKKEEVKDEEVTLVMSEKFIPISHAEHYAREFNSLVFQVRLCLV